MTIPSQLNNYINGEWRPSAASAYLDVTNPATQEPLAQVPLSPAADVALAVQAAATALPAWRNTPPGDRIQPLFKLKALLEQHFDDIARTITLECGKTLNESRGEMRAGHRECRSGLWHPNLDAGRCAGRHCQGH